jgi:hypothetical protein
MVSFQAEPTEEFLPAASALLSLPDLHPNTVRTALREGMSAIRRGTQELDDLYAEELAATANQTRRS